MAAKQEFTWNKYANTETMRLVLNTVIISHFTKVAQR